MHNVGKIKILNIINQIIFNKHKISCFHFDLFYCIISSRVNAYFNILVLVVP